MRVGIVGCGTIAEVHAAALSDLPGVRVVGLADVNPRRARDLGARLGLEDVYGSLTDLVAARRPDVVHVLTPPQTHASLAIEALESGCHVLVEKPMAASAEEAEAMARAAQRAGRRLCVDHNHLFDPVVARARALVGAGAVGQVVWVESLEGFDIGNPDNPYVQPGAAGHWVHGLRGGIFHNLAPHPAYLVLAFVPGAAVVHAAAQKTGRVPTAFADELRVLVASDTAMGCFMVSLSIQPFMKFVNVYGTEGTLRVNLTTSSLTHLRSRNLPRALGRAALSLEEGLQLLASTGANAARVATGRLRAYPGLRALIREFYRSLAEGRPPPVDAEAGCALVRILDVVWERLGR